MDRTTRSTRDGRSDHWQPNWAENAGHYVPGKRHHTSSCTDLRRRYARRGARSGNIARIRSTYLGKFFVDGEEKRDLLGRIRLWTEK